MNPSSLSANRQRAEGIGQTSSATVVRVRSRPNRQDHLAVVAVIRTGRHDLAVDSPRRRRVVEMAAVDHPALRHRHEVAEVNHHAVAVRLDRAEAAPEVVHPAKAVHHEVVAAVISERSKPSDFQL